MFTKLLVTNLIMAKAQEDVPSFIVVNNNDWTTVLCIILVWSIVLISSLQYLGLVNFKKEEVTVTVVTGPTRNISTQSQCTYTYWKTTPRFTPLQEKAHGAWEI